MLAPRAVRGIPLLKRMMRCRMTAGGRGRNGDGSGSILEKRLRSHGSLPEADRGLWDCPLFPNEQMATL